MPSLNASNASVQPVTIGRACDRITAIYALCEPDHARKARSHCKRGHPLSGANLFVTSAGSRGCKECRKLHKQTYRSKTNG